ncbi:MAG: host factor-I protein [Pseudomonadota bacterium]|nr:host factor-I protein [Pseudomonadota bacterium]
MNTQNFEKQYLEHLKNNNINVSVYLINGIKLSGLIAEYDDRIIILKDNKSTVDQLIYKHSVSTIMPAKTVHATAHTDHS